jgi:hypothetical protein
MSIENKLVLKASSFDDLSYLIKITWAEHENCANKGTIANN